MAVHTLKMVQLIPVSLEHAWAFFSSPANLELITPPDMRFTVTSAQHERMFPGQIIEYKVRPLLNIPVYWMTEITYVQEGSFFVDEQRQGPYSLWHHQHHFREIQGGVEMTDHVHYKIPLGFLGEIANGLFVKNRLRSIFEYRYRQIEKRMGSWEGQSCRIEIR